ncbi:hypothetical protein J3U68_02550 [Snodgrassella sp. B3882]|uniref:hypothetical protein n=1 Tax=Snodgrassella sp. B3882 TaxID=2818037 RepID=UPI002269EA40|nr:hypothetical protein [Snodgrassella sp. B3882]MCX8744288.1 hypothetical protein [Snodgrassella sp. B3882]
MKLPKFLMADNSDFPLDAFVVHTENPRFILILKELKEEVVKCFDELEGDEEEALNELNLLVRQAFDFFESEIRKSEDEDDEEE